MPAPSLAFYEQQTQLLLNDVAQAEYNLADLDIYINLGRGQIAAAAQCIRFTGTLITAATVAEYPITDFSTPAGVNNPLTEPRIILLRTSGNMKVRLEKRNWEWFLVYQIAANPLPAPGPPAVWSTQEQGASGTVFFSPTPDNAYILDANLIGYPLDLSPTQTTEAIPYPWTDSVAYFAAYWALMNTQREADAHMMEQRWIQFMTWAGRQVTSTVLPSYDPGGVSAALAASKIPNTGVGMPQAPGRGGGGMPAPAG
jgi:hypothetical protein